MSGRVKVLLREVERPKLWLKRHPLAIEGRTIKVAARSVN
jgi:hypothetical protein